MVLFEDVRIKGKYLKLAHKYLLTNLHTIKNLESFFEQLENFA